MEDLRLNNAADPFNVKLDVRSRTARGFGGVIDSSAQTSSAQKVEEMMERKNELQHNK